MSTVLVKFKASPKNMKTVGKITFVIESQVWCSFTVMNGQYGLFFLNTVQKYTDRNGEEKEVALNLIKQKDGFVSTKILDYIAEQNQENFEEDLDVILDRQKFTTDKVVESFGTKQDDLPIPDDDEFPF